MVPPNISRTYALLVLVYHEAKYNILIHDMGNMPSCYFTWDCDGEAIKRGLVIQCLAWELKRWESWEVGREGSCM